MRVLLVEQGWHATMYLARALVGAGHAVTVVTANGTGARCRHAGADWVSCPAIEDPDFAGAIDGLVRDRTIDRVLPLTEAAMSALWDHPRAWPTAEPWQRALLSDKHALLAYVAARGVPVPAQRPLALDDRDLRAVRFPVVLKGATGSGGRRVAIAEDADALAAAVARARRVPDRWMLQDFVPGPTYLVGGVLDAGRPLRLYAGEKVEQHPARTGGAIHLRSLADPALIDTATRAFAALRWTGFASADLVRDADGRYLLLEINPRMWGSLAAAAAAGVDLFAPFAALLAGEVPAADLAFAPGVAHHVFPRYLNAGAHRTLAGARRALRDLGDPHNADWLHPRFVVHILWRLYWMKRSARSTTIG